MPHKFNADRRDKIPKLKRRVTNCAEYDQMHRRGDLTDWISDDALAVWPAQPRRGMSLSAKAVRQNATPVQLVVDSTGLKIFSEGIWLEEKHKTRGRRRSWRKLHLGLDLDLDLASGQIV